VGLIFRKFERDDGPAIANLYEEILGRKHSADWLDWKFYQNPAGVHGGQMAEDAGRVVAMVGIRPITMMIQGEEVTACHSCDVMISSRYRKGTPFFRLHKETTKGIEHEGWHLVYGTSVKDTFRISMKLLGFTTAGPIKKQLKILNPAPYLRMKLKLAPLSGFLGFLASLAMKVVYWPWMRAASDVAIKEVDEFDSRFDELWQKRRSDYEIMIVRDTTYLDWRYLKNPAQKYKIFTAERNGVLEGFAVACVKDENIRRGYIIDLLAPPGDTALIRSLIAHAVRYCAREKADTVSCWWLEHTPAREISRKMGFLTFPTNHDLIVRSHGRHGNEYLSKRDRWYFTMADTDHY